MSFRSLDFLFILGCYSFVAAPPRARGLVPLCVACVMVTCSSSFIVANYNSLRLSGDRPAQVAGALPQQLHRATLCSVLRRCDALCGAVQCCDELCTSTIAWWAAKQDASGVGDVSPAALRECWRGVCCGVKTAPQLSRVAKCARRQQCMESIPRVH